MKVLFAVGSIMGGLALALGAFGSHGLKASLGPESLAIWETGTRYQMYHALAVILIAICCSRWPKITLLPLAGTLMIAGALTFSSSLYALSFTGIKWLGAVTPVGGVILIAGWLCLALAARQLE